jgi:hypothetical protein
MWDIPQIEFSEPRVQDLGIIKSEIIHMIQYENTYKMELTE